MRAVRAINSCLSSNSRLYALQCYHIFCQKCLPKVCKLINRNQRLLQCGICDKVARCAEFPEDFLKFFVPIKFNGFFRTIDFRMKYQKRRVILMRGRLFKIRNAVKRLYQQGYVVQRQKRNYLKRKREAIRRHLLNEFSNDYIDWLISYPLRRLQGMRFQQKTTLHFRAH
ncbi:uncharacterized protein LOC129568189 [Sitodiplosis mosellana]|uniref:uncharacterized protein LOC129568189 n=1 Tax=Sitodiplosis mosellana TaxID=263140 RepID=UPI002444BE4A|nr:uncharacterized protein LOC129568189 [Sitodiplosis mosellana]